MYLFVIYTFKRLGLGLLLIAAASAILLLSDRDRRVPAAGETIRIAILQHTDSTVMEDGVRGLMDALASRGYGNSEKVRIERFNAQGDMPTGVAIARQLTGGGYNLVITSSTPSMQAVANNNRDAQVRHVFALVADPFASGVGLDRGSPMTHPAYMVGQGSFPPVEVAFEHARRMFPDLKRIGVAWNPSESNSLAFVEKGRAIGQRMGIELLEANADSTSAVTDAINSLIARDAQAIWVGGDNTIAASINSVIATARRARIPVFSVLPGAPDRGTLFDAGFDFYEVGRQGGLLAADVLDGTDIATIPIRDVVEIVPAFLSVNTTVLGDLRDTWRVPEELLASANVLVDADGIHRREASRAAAPESDPPPLGRKWRLQLIELNQTTDVEEAEKGVLDGLTDAGLVEGRDYEKVIRNAQGDMATLSGLVDAAVTDRADMLITFSTPTLQAAMQRTKALPIVFNYLADPIAAGAATSDTSHVENVTGVYLIGAYRAMLPLIRAFRPQAKVLGTVYVPAEVNMVSQLEALHQAATEAGMEIKAVAANSTGEVADATLALIANGVDAICQLPGNLTASAYPSIAQAARQARMPVFVFQSSQVRAGAVLGLSRDYYQSGFAAAGLAARVMRGEQPARIPLLGFADTKLLVNLDAARAAGLTAPASIVGSADEVIGK
jgi:ABC-type uncharacterized transport system substrate-binding protein